MLKIIKLIFILLVLSANTYSQFSSFKKIFISFEGEEYQINNDNFLFRPNNQIAIDQNMNIAIGLIDDIVIFDENGNYNYKIQYKAYKEELEYINSNKLIWQELNSPSWPYQLNICIYNVEDKSIHKKKNSMLDWYEELDNRYSMYRFSQTIRYYYDTIKYKHDLYKPSSHKELLNLYLCSDSVICLAIPDCFKVFKYRLDHNYENKIIVKQYEYKIFISEEFNEWSRIVYFNDEVDNYYAIYFNSNNNLYYENLETKQIYFYENRNVPYIHYKKIYGKNIIYHISELTDDGLYIEFLTWE
jgi:hypothetical protein